MKRTLAALLSALMLLTILPLASPPAKADVYFDLACSVSSALTGETFYWYVYNVSGGSGNYEYAFDVYRNDWSYAPEDYRNNVRWRDYTPPTPGNYQVVVYVYDITTDEEYYAISDVVKVTANPNKIKSVEPVSATSLKITWNKIPGATDYYLIRSTDQKIWELATGWTTATSFTDTGLTAGKRYFYKVGYEQGNDGIIYSDWYSSTAVGVPMGKTRITGITSPSKGRVRLAWAKAAGASGYQVLMATSARGSYKPVRQLTGNSVILTGLKSGATLYFKVRPYRKIYSATYWAACSPQRGVKVK